MPITLKKTEKTPVVLEKEGSRFHFRLNYRDILKIQDEFTRRGELQINSYYHALFEKSMVDWENVTDESGKAVPFSEKVREVLIFGESRVFTEKEILDTALKVVGKVKAEKGDTPGKN